MNLRYLLLGLIALTCGIQTVAFSAAWLDMPDSYFVSYYVSAVVALCGVVSCGVGISAIYKGIWK